MIGISVMPPEGIEPVVSYQKEVDGRWWFLGESRPRPCDQKEVLAEMSRHKGDRDAKMVLVIGRSLIRSVGVKYASGQFYYPDRGRTWATLDEMIADLSRPEEQCGTIVISF